MKGMSIRKVKQIVILHTYTGKGAHDVRVSEYFQTIKAPKSLRLMMISIERIQFELFPTALKFKSA